MPFQLDPIEPMGFPQSPAKGYTIKERFHSVVLPSDLTIPSISQSFPLGVPIYLLHPQFASSIPAVEACRATLTKSR